MTLSVVTMLWPGPAGYQPEHVNALAWGVDAHLSIEHRFHVFAAGFGPSEFGAHVTYHAMPAAAAELLSLASPEGPSFPSSYARLWLLSGEAAWLGRILLLDIDCVPVGNLNSLDWLVQYSDAPFVGWSPRSRWGQRGRIAGGTWLADGGALSAVWREFSDSPETAIRRTREHHFRGSDQSWLSFKLAGRCDLWPEPNGLYQRQDQRTGPPRPADPKRPAGAGNPLLAPVWPLPEDARLVHFNGPAKPWDRLHWPWVRAAYGAPPS